jgi:hypothetical protein
MTDQTRSKDPLLNLADAMVEDIMGMTEAEILAEASPEEMAAAEGVRQEVLKLLDKWGRDAAADDGERPRASEGETK